MSNIPGLSYFPVDEDKGQGIEVEGFHGVNVIPEAHVHGNHRILSNFVKLGVMSEGEFGTIYKCRDKTTDKIYALKKYKMPDLYLHGFSAFALREINLLSDLKHDNIVNSHGTIAGRNIESNYLILDYYAMSLEQLIAREVPSLYESEVVKFIMKQLFQGLKFIHESLIIHRDINCNNIVFAPDGTLKITGFTTARFLSRGNMSPKETELRYRAPELLFQAAQYNSAVDIWSAGCVFARLLLKEHIFTGSTELEVIRSILTVLGKPSESIWPGFDTILELNDSFLNLIKDQESHSVINDMLADVSIAIKELLLDILIYYPQARMTASKSLRSSYFREHPRECSRDYFKSILKNFVDSDEAMSEGD